MNWTLSAEGTKEEIKSILKDKKDPGPIFPWWMWAIVIIAIILMSR